ncbi:hypothetical protein CASFOL_010788 [Castilleja foliolosa]|uniref:Phytocyanin domain-containing protein n=1 Tax=Castilleja foliolosa TaxID=1961234 RepID=A0ABD3DTL4_9LAMI
MALSRVSLIMILVAVTVIVPCLCTDYMVGDDVGWRLGVDYSAWARGKDFRVGDTLVFKYYPGAHNVVEVNETDYRNCASSNVSRVPSTSGIDIVNLTTPGTKGYICSIGEHCSGGMKLAITVSSTNGLTLAPFSSSSSPTSGAHEVSPLKSWVLSVLMIVVMWAFMMIMV